MATKLQKLAAIRTLAATDNEMQIAEFITDNSDSLGFDGSMNDIHEIMDIPRIEVLEFFNKLFDKKLLLRLEYNRHNFN